MFVSDNKDTPCPGEKCLVIRNSASIYLGTRFQQTINK